LLEIGACSPVQATLVGPPHPAQPWIAVVLPDGLQLKMRSSASAASAAGPVDESSPAFSGVEQEVSGLAVWCVGVHHLSCTVRRAPSAECRVPCAVCCLLCAVCCMLHAACCEHLWQLVCPRAALTCLVGSHTDPLLLDRRPLSISGSYHWRWSMRLGHEKRQESSG
jgi:hypothetical protein